MQDQNSQSILVLEDVNKRREQGGIAFELQIPALKLEQGDFVAIVGDSGCGKSTLLDMLALVSQPTSAAQFSYYFNGHQAQSEAVDIGKLWQTSDEQALANIRRSRLGYVLQTGGLLPFVTVLQNIQLPAKLNGNNDTSYAEQLAERIGVKGVLGKKPQFLSGGQRQRVAILRALVHHPQIIFADEPTAAVDKKRAESIVADFHTLAKENGTTIVMVTHDRQLIESRADKTYSFEISEASDSLTVSIAIAI